jgi:NADH-ubiquinone oxidoreductase chain 2
MLFISILSLITAKAVKLININHIQFTRISFLILLYAGTLSFNVLSIHSIGSGIGIYNGYFHITQITQIIEIIMFTVAGLILLAWPKITNTCPHGIHSRPLMENNYNESVCGSHSGTNIEMKGDNYSSNYSILILFSILGSSLLISSFDLISLYLSIELQSFGLYVLSTLYRNSESSTSAGLKYFLLGALSSCIILLGSGIIYSYSGVTNLESLYLLNSVTGIINIDSNVLNSLYSIQGINLGIILIFIGFLFKIAAAPLHNWSPDVYDEVPTIVTTWLTIIPKMSILFLLLELQVNLYHYSQISLLTSDSVIKNILLISSLLSLIIGSLLGLSQIKIKRLLAYSTISHIGFILLALAINTEQSIDSFIFYILQYTITNLNIFLIILALSYKQNKINTTKEINETNKDINYIYQFKGLFSNNPLLCISLAICLFSMAGIPPLIGFFSKQFVLYSALQNGYYFISIIAILVSIISASYYLQIIKNMYNLDESIYTASKDKFNNNTNLKLLEDSVNELSPLSNIHSYVISILTIIIIFFFIKPTILLNGTQLLALSLFYN